MWFHFPSGVHQICGIQIHGHVTLVKNGAFKVCESDARLTPVDLWQFFQSASKPEDVPSSSSMVPKTTLVKESVVPFSGVGHRLGRSLSPLAQPPFLALPAPPSPNSSATASATDSNADPTFDASSDITPTGTVQCPVCFQSVPADYVNEHLDACLTAAWFAFSSR